jgi:hypothetical protein
MDFLKKMEETKVGYDKLNEARTQRLETIQKTQEEVIAIEAEMKKMEGSFATLVGLAKEAGQLDEAGNPIKKEADADGIATDNKEEEK